MSEHAAFSDGGSWALWHDGVRCAGLRQDGKRCNNVARKNSTLCYWHTPGAVQERNERIRKALDAWSGARPDTLGP